MKKLAFLVLSIIILFSAQQVAATSDKKNEHATNNPSVQKRLDHQGEELETSVTPSVVIEYKNHGEYVSSVAITHPGGKIVSEAARSDIGKKHSGDVTLNPSITLSPTESPTATPSETLSPTETPSETPTPTESQSQILELKTIIEQLKDLIKALKDALHLN